MVRVISSQGNLLAYTPLRSFSDEGVFRNMVSTYVMHSLHTNNTERQMGLW